MDAGDLKSEAIVEEYKALKSEQLGRIVIRDHLLYANITIVGAVSYFALGSHQSVHALLIVPWSSLLLGWAYLANDTKISEIRDYLAKHQSKTGETLFVWELKHHQVTHRLRYKRIQLFVDFVAFVATGALAIAIYLVSEPINNWWQYLALLSGAILLAVLLVEFLEHLKRETAKRASPHG